MPHESQFATSASLAERKKELIAQGAAFRAQIIDSRNGVRASLRPEALAQQAIDYATTTALAAFRNGGAMRIADIDLPTVLPLITAAWSALSKLSLPKRITRTALILGAAGAVAVLVLKIKKARNGDAGNGAGAAG